MIIEYDFYQNPIPDGSDRKSRLHARVVTRGTATTDELAQTISLRSSLTRGDVMAVLSNLSDLMVEELARGRRIHLEGLGYFSLVLDCPPVKTGMEVRAESIKVRNIAFRTEEKMKKRIARLPVQRVRNKNKSADYSDIEIDDILTVHFLDNDYITGSNFRVICGLTRTTAGRRLKKLVDEGRLSRLGQSKSAVYVPTKGNYRR